MPWQTDAEKEEKEYDKDSLEECQEGKSWAGGAATDCSAGSSSMSSSMLNRPEGLPPFVTAVPVGCEPAMLSSSDGGSACGSVFRGTSRER